MASPDQTPQASLSPTASKSASKLDSLPREDLVKFIKKQSLVLQKTKAKCTELEEDLKKLKENTTATTETTTATTETTESHVEELTRLRQENLELVHAHELALTQAKARETVS
ncbi:hypothetical protein NP493_446g01005 [Ridgeia piscesae]|uniref:Uncharacterized protein n=1 Tax=Ridgeia piscesae TaxID=27915 RepID=A0AAD9KZ54_RIDPI|nr:hypothetical protein NP493_446g01005 [Ridgeia piscesae]